MDGERVGSERTEQLVRLAVEKFRREELPPMRHVRRYAALLAAAERQTMFEAAASNTAYLEAHKAEGAEYGINGRENPEGARKAHHRGMQCMSQLLPLAAKASKTLWRLVQLHRKCAGSLPALLKHDYPESRLSGWHLELGAFSHHLSAGIKPACRLPTNPQSKGPGLMKSHCVFCGGPGPPGILADGPTWLHSRMFGASMN